MERFEYTRIILGTIIRVSESVSIAKMLTFSLPKVKIIVYLGVKVSHKSTSVKIVRIWPE